MACEGNRSAFFTQVSAPDSAAAQAFGSPEAAKQALDDLFAIGRGGPRPPAEARLAEAQTRLMFTQMQRRSIRPPTHSASGLPKPDAQFGYALVQRTLSALERGEPLPPQARDLFLARQRERQIGNLRADARGRVRCGSCGELPARSAGMSASARPPWRRCAGAWCAGWAYRRRPTGTSSWPRCWMRRARATCCCATRRPARPPA